MARLPRQEVEPGIHHVYARGIERREIFRDDRDRTAYLQRLGAIVVRQRWHCLAYCLMPNHVHLLIETREANLANGMQRLHGGYAQAFNKRHDRAGHLFQNRYGTKRVETDAQLWLTASYIAVNPVAAGLCDRPDQWQWCSHGPVLARKRPEWLDAARLFWYFGALGGNGRRRYAEFVEERLSAAA